MPTSRTCSKAKIKNITRALHQIQSLVRDVCLLLIIRDERVLQICHHNLASMNSIISTHLCIHTCHLAELDTLVINITVITFHLS